MPYNSAMTAVLKCNNCAKSGREASSIMMYLARYAAKRGLEARSAEVEARSRLVHYCLSQRRRALALAHDCQSIMFPLPGFARSA